MDTLTIVLVYSIGPLIVGGLLAHATYKLDKFDISAFAAMFDATDDSAWLIYPLRPLLWINVRLLMIASKLAKLIKKQPWYLQLVIFYVMGVVAFIPIWLNEPLESPQAD